VSEESDYDGAGGEMMTNEMEKMKVVEGSQAIAYAVKACKPHVVSAYPITPQTHIVEELSKLVANGEIKCEYINVESEFSAISMLIGASATGARTFTSTTSQGLALMHEALFNASGMRLPIVMVTVNRALSAPINIWNDQQDSIAERDAGWIQFYAEDIQEASDMLAQAYRVAEDRDVLLPAMVCIDGFILSHTYEPVILLEEDITEEYLPSYDPPYRLDPTNPKSFGTLGTPDVYMEARYMQEKAMETALDKIKEAAIDFKRMYGRWHGDLVDTYRVDDADIILISMGSVVGTMKEAVDRARDEGVKVGIVKLRVFRPFPKKELVDTLKNAKVVAVIEKDVCVGKYEGALTTELKAVLYSYGMGVPVLGRIAGLGGRDITLSHIMSVITDSEKVLEGKDVDENAYLGLREEVL